MSDQQSKSLDSSKFPFAPFDLVDAVGLGPKTKKAVALGAVGMGVYSAVKKIITTKRAERIYTVTINGSDLAFDLIHDWLIEALPEDRRRALVVSSRLYPTEDEGPLVAEESVSSSKWTSSRKRPGVSLKYDSSETQTVNIYGHRVQITVNERATNNVKFEGASSDFWSSLSSLKLRAADAAGRDAILKLIDDLIRRESMVERKAEIWVTNRWGNWRRNQSLRPRTLESVVLNDGIVDDVVADLRLFLDSENEYIRRSMPYHRGYLFHGKPGTGKTSLVRALATAFNLDLWVMSLGDIAADADLLHLVSEVNHGILLLEDIDSFYAARDRDLDEKSDHLSLSALLNSLDGALTPHGLITMMTTNRIDFIDPALYRPGRIDRSIRIDEAGWLQVVAMIEQWHGVGTWIFEPREIDGAELLDRNWNPADVIEALRQTSTANEAIRRLLSPQLARVAS